MYKKMTSLPLQEVSGLLFLYRGQRGGPGTWRRRARSRWPSRFGWCWHYTPPVRPVFRRRPIVPDSEAPRISAVLPHSIFVITPADRRSSMNLSHGGSLLSLGWFYYSTSAFGCQEFFFIFFYFFRDARKRINPLLGAEPEALPTRRRGAPNNHGSYSVFSFPLGWL